VILAHLGNADSLAAVRDGKSIDTSTGFIPSAGLVVRTRSGGLDPGRVSFNLKAELEIRHLHQKIDHLLSHQWERLVKIHEIQIDHIHLAVEIPPKYSVSEAVGFLKGKSAIKIFDFHLELKRRYWGRHVWAKGYCVSTVGLDED
jgi:acetate kinase